MRRRSCVEIANARAWHARERVRTSLRPLSPLRGEIAFAVVWVATFMSSLVMAPFRARIPGNPKPTYEPTLWELGVPGSLRPRPPHGRLLHGRYRATPTMTRILRDLRRPAARDAARAALMARLGSDLDTLNWTAGLVDSDSQWRLALHARPGISDADVVAAWRAEARADRAAAEAEAAAALRTSIGAANAAEDAADGGFAFRAPGF